LIDKINRIIKDDFPHINTILIMQDNKVILSENYNGFQDNDLHKAGCIFKSFISALVGIALKEKLITSLEQKLIDFYSDELPDKIDDGFSSLTLRHILTNSSGINWPGSNERIPADIQEVFKLTFKDMPGTSFEYKPDPQIIVYLLEKLTGNEFISYADEKLMKPLGIKHYTWKKLHMEDMRINMGELVKLGELYLCKGNWNEVTLFDENYYYESVKFQVVGGFPELTNYGYYWWIDKYQNIDFFYASGFGGQIMCVVPKLNLITIIMSQMDRPHMENKIIIRNIIGNLQK